MRKLAIALAFVASTAYAAIDGTPHDLMTLPGNTATGACQYCHMPHHANSAATGTGAPLWAKTVRSAYTVVGTTAAGTAVGQPAGPSQACLSCHDGTAAAVTTQHNAQTLATAYTINGGVAGNTNVGLNISDDHPVSFTYSNAAPNLAGLATITAARTAGFVFFGAGQDQLECGSCHDPHTQNATAGNFIRGTNADFCGACHSLK